MVIGKEIGKDWAAEAAREIVSTNLRALTGPPLVLNVDTMSDMAVKAVIEKHCPFTRGVLYSPVPMWHPIEQAPLREGAYIVFAPSANPAQPLITTAWFSPTSGWVRGLPDVWLRALTHWMDPEPPTNTGSGV